MVLEYDWKADAYCLRFDDPFPMIGQSFETLAVARLALRLVGLRLGAKTDPRTWQIEFLEPVAERTDAQGEDCRKLALGVRRAQLESIGPGYWPKHRVLGLK
jgi:hypothetical protein